MTTAHKWPDSDFGKFVLPTPPAPVISHDVKQLLLRCADALESTMNNLETLLIVQHAALEFQLEQEARKREAGAPPDNSSHQG